MRLMEYSVKTDSSTESEWVEDYLSQVRKCNELAAQGINATIMQREVQYSTPYKAKMRVEVDRLEEALYTQLAANTDLVGLSDEKIRNLAQELSINSLPFFAEALASSLYAEAREMYDSEARAGRLEQAENFISWLRSLGGVGCWSNTAGNNDMKTFRRKGEKEESEEEEPDDNPDEDL